MRRNAAASSSTEAFRVVALSSASATTLTAQRRAQSTAAASQSTAIADPSIASLHPTPTHTCTSASNSEPASEAAAASEQQEQKPLTVHDPSNALVSALFTVQHKFNVFSTGDTVVDVGCLPGTSSRCFRQWIDGPADAEVGAEEKTADMAGEDRGSEARSSNTVDSHKKGAGSDSTGGSSQKTTVSAAGGVEEEDPEIASAIQKGMAAAPSSSNHWRAALLRRQREKKEARDKRRISSKGEKNNNNNNTAENDALQNPSVREGKECPSPTPSESSNLSHPRQQQWQQRKGFIVGIDAFKRDGLSDAATIAQNNSTAASSSTNSHAQQHSSDFYVGDVLVSKTVQELSTDALLLERLSGSTLRLAGAPLAAGAGGAGSHHHHLRGEINGNDESLASLRTATAAMSEVDKLKAEALHRRSTLLTRRGVAAGGPSSPSFSVLASEAQQVEKGGSAVMGSDGKADVVFIDLCPLLEKELADTAAQLIATLPPSPPSSPTALLPSGAAVEGGGNVSGESVDDAATEEALAQSQAAAAAAVRDQLSMYHPARHPQYYTRVSLPMLAENKAAEHTTLMRRRMRHMHLLERSAERQEALRSLAATSSIEAGGGENNKNNSIQNGNKECIGGAFEVLTPGATHTSAEAASPTNALLDPSAASSSSSLRGVSSGESAFYDVSDNATAFEVFLEHAESLVGGCGGNKKGGKNGGIVKGRTWVDRAIAKAQKEARLRGEDGSIIEGGGAKAIVVKRSDGAVHVMRDDSSDSYGAAADGGGSNAGINNRINFYEYPAILDSSAASASSAAALAMFRPAPLSTDTLFLTSLESTAAAVRLLKPYLRPFREADHKEMLPTSAAAATTKGGGGSTIVGGAAAALPPPPPLRRRSPTSPLYDDDNGLTPPSSSATSAAGGTAGKFLIRLVIPSEAELGGSEEGLSDSSQIDTSRAMVPASATRRTEHSVATSIGAISAAYHAFIDSLQSHFSFVEVVDRRRISTPPTSSSSSSSTAFGELDAADEAPPATAPFTEFVQLLVLAHNASSPLVASEQTNAPRAVKDNPAFILFDRELILQSEAPGGANFVGGPSASAAGNRHVRAHGLKHDLPSAGIVLPSSDGLGSARHGAGAANANANAASGSNASGGGRKPKFRGVFKYLSQTSANSVDFNADRGRSKMRHTAWSPNKGFSSAPHRAPNASSVTSMRAALTSAVATTPRGSSSSSTDRFTTLASLSSGSRRPASLQLVGQNVVDASTKTFTTVSSSSTIASSSPRQQLSAPHNKKRTLSLASGTVVSASASSGGGGAAQRSVNGLKSRYFTSRYPGLLQAPPPAEELALRMRRAVVEEERLEAAQERFNQFKMESIDNFHMQKVVGETR